MSDKQTPPPTPAASALPDHRVIALAGRDAVAFLQAQAMNDVAALADGQWQWNGWLTPKGRIVALFAVLRRDPETLWLLAADADPQALAEALRRFVFRSKVAISVRDDLLVSGAFAAPMRARAAVAAELDDGRVELDLGGDGGPRTLWIGPAAVAADGATVARWQAFDLAHGWPRLPPSQQGTWTPQQLSLERLPAFSVKKGCYPGQEIVARTHFLGQAKRGLARLRCSVAVAPGARVLHDGHPIGEVVAAAADDGRDALAVVALERRDGSPLQVDDATATTLPLLDGLAR